MHPSVSDAWPRVAREHEGVCAWLYLDTVRKVTTGIGTLLDDGTGEAPATCLGLPWTTGGKPATRAQIASAWKVVKSRTDLAPRGGFAFRDVTTLRLEAKVIDGLLMARTREFWSILSAQLPGLESWPADAQLGLLDMSYQLGPRFLGSKWPSFTAAAHAEDFIRCAEHCSVRQAPPSRNQARQRWFRNADLVVELGINPAILWDDRTPEEEDDMPLTEADLKKIVAALKPLIPTADQVAERVLLKDGVIVNDGIHLTGGDHVTLKTAIEVIAQRTAQVP